MACCGKKRRPKVKRLEEEPKLLKNALKLLQEFKDVNPSQLKKKTLADYHMKTHTLYTGNLKQRPLKKPFINTIVSLHDKFVKEMLNRNMKHNTPIKSI